MNPADLRLIHIGLAALSISGFVLRWAWMHRGSALLHHRITQVLPHVIDTLFLLSGIALAVMIHQAPLADGWLTAKVAGLVAYVVLGSLALKRAPTKRLKTVFFVTALLCFAWIVSVARSKSPWGWLAEFV